ncbi:glucosamine 6-phosphate N-acetyltransferase [Adelges cooleyi]|uniref:glucosamine 6-phosphate N-acetyltransferase n=1 Tax=Adelges cooleyi TaxID=133065 RepID=UPI00218035F1|nr:glucosamine 6-phosphate N-acetyltransferase [Adelges cooleyi]
MDCEIEKYIFDPNSLSTDKGDVGHGMFTYLNNDQDRFLLRPLCLDDYERGYIGLLSQLTSTGDVTKEMFTDTFNVMKNNNGGTHYIIVVHDTQKNRIVATGSLIIEKKFIHSCGKRARVEDIVVDSDYRGKGFGKIIVQRLIALAKILKCYKISLECLNAKVNWYGSMGFVQEPGNSNFMQIRFQQD